MFDMTPPSQETVARTPFEAMPDDVLEAWERSTAYAVEMTNDEDAKADLRAIRLEIVARELERSEDLGFEFDMHTGFLPVAPKVAGFDLLTQSWLVEDAPNHCGTAGCIAGLTYALWLERQPVAVRRERLEEAYTNLDAIHSSGDEAEEVPWDGIRLTAQRWLGLTRESDMDEKSKTPFSTFYGPKLFSSEILRPNGLPSGAASAKVAAEACRRVARGQDPWDW